MDALTEHEGLGVFSDAGIPVAEHALVEDADGAAAAAAELGYPVVLKVDSADVQHKTDMGAVMTAHDEEEVRKRFDLVMRNVEEAAPDADIEGVLVQEHLDGHEMIVGVNRDEEFGPVVMFGLGGIFVEILHDVNFRALPLAERDARELVDEMRARALLDGVRGDPPADIDAVVDVLLAVSDLVEDQPVAELDINPLFVNADGAVAADALVVMDR
ncbi:MAG: acetate--CoA ligase family protein [Candidatus Nanohaloarchaea archaeon]|nr:acetate--CoA ligase family protein [Candidatus Nanohaloarchaea archaeon]